jgi:hypothetical protein
MDSVALNLKDCGAGRLQIELLDFFQDLNDLYFSE